MRPMPTSGATCTVQEFASAGIRLVQALGSTNAFSRRLGHRGHAEIQYVLQDLGAVGAWIDKLGDEHDARRLATTLRVPSLDMPVGVLPLCRSSDIHAQIERTITEDSRAVEDLSAGFGYRDLNGSGVFVFPQTSHDGRSHLPPVKVKLDMYNPERHLHLSTMIAQPVEYPQGTVLVQTAASLLSDALTMLHDTEGDASPVEKAQAALVILLVWTLSKTHGPASMNLDLADWVKFVDTIEEEHYRQLKSYADEVHRGDETPQHVATFLLQHIEAEGRLSEAVLEREIKDALRWASEFLLIRPKGGIRAPAATQLASLGRHTPSRFFPQDRRLATSSRL